MYARLTRSQIKPAAQDETTRRCRELILPAAKREEGFKGMLLLLHPDDGPSAVVTLWESEMAMLAGEASGYLEAQMAELAPLLATPPVRQAFAVRALEGIMPAATTAHLLSFRVNPPLLDDFVDTYRNRVLTVADQQRNFSGGLVLTDRQLANAVAINLWDSARGTDSEPNGDGLSRQLPRVYRLLLEPPVSEPLTVGLMEILP